MTRTNYNENVFINCPFDDQYDGIFHGMIFTIFDCGFTARCAKEENNSANIRIEKIFKIISESKYGIHDISRTELSPKTKLPRFNMPLELGMFLGAKKYGNAKQQQKNCLILDKEQFRYNKYISDINGQDISAHKNNIKIAINVVAEWLRSESPKKNRVAIPGGAEIFRRYKLFSKELPIMCSSERLRPSEISFNDYAGFVSEWIKQNKTI